jgi:hypothetical protein
MPNRTQILKHSFFSARIHLTFSSLKPLIDICSSLFGCFTDWQKTKSQRERETLLLEELVKIVDKRNELVQNQDCQEKA